MDRIIHMVVLLVSDNLSSPIMELHKIFAPSVGICLSSNDYAGECEEGP